MSNSLEQLKASGTVRLSPIPSIPYRSTLPDYVESNPPPYPSYLKLC